MQIGEQIERERTAAGLSRAELAKRAGLTRMAIWRVERGLGRPETKQRIAAALNCEVVEVLVKRTTAL